MPDPIAAGAGKPAERGACGCEYLVDDPAGSRPGANGGAAPCAANLRFTETRGLLPAGRPPRPGAWRPARFSPRSISPGLPDRSTRTDSLGVKEQDGHNDEVGEEEGDQDENPDQTFAVGGHGGSIRKNGKHETQNTNRSPGGMNRPAVPCWEFNEYATRKKETRVRGVRGPVSSMIHNIRQ